MSGAVLGQQRGWISRLGPSSGSRNLAWRRKAHLGTRRPSREGCGHPQVMECRSGLVSSRSQGPRGPCRLWVVSGKVTGPFSQEEGSNPQLRCLGGCGTSRPGNSQPSHCSSHRTPLPRGLDFQKGEACPGVGCPITIATGLALSEILVQCRLLAVTSSGSGC